MCLNITNNLTKDILEKNTNANLVNFLEWQLFENVTANCFFPVITNEFANVIQYFKWGLVPVWAKNLAMGNNMTKTKKENLFEKTALQAIYRYKRCVVPVTSFTIWLNKKQNETYLFKSKENNLFLLLGLWDVWGEGLQTFSIITQQKEFKNEIVDMPLFISIEQIPNWLNKKEASLSLLDKLKIEPIENFN